MKPLHAIAPRRNRVRHSGPGDCGQNFCLCVRRLLLLECRDLHRGHRRFIACWQSNAVTAVDAPGAAAPAGAGLADRRACDARDGRRALRGTRGDLARRARAPRGRRGASRYCAVGHGAPDSKARVLLMKHARDGEGHTRTRAALGERVVPLQNSPCSFMSFHFFQMLFNAILSQQLSHRESD
jgi:hypothetical protein